MILTWIKIAIRATNTGIIFTILTHQIYTSLTAITLIIADTSTWVSSTSYTALAIYKMAIRTAFAWITIALFTANTFCHMT
jgi:hypothetical protein